VFGSSRKYFSWHSLHRDIPEGEAGLFKGKEKMAQSTLTQQFPSI
jgi:hypothetical protein